MDFQNAVILVAVAAGVIELLKVLLGSWAKNPRVVVLTTIIASIGVTLGLRYSAWADKQVVEGVPLDEMSVASLLVVAVALACVETAVYLGLKAGTRSVANIGENQPSSYLNLPPGLDVSQEAPPVHTESDVLPITMQDKYRGPEAS